MTGFGIDTWCGERLVSGRFASGRQAAALAMLRRIQTPRGTLTPIDLDGDEAELSYGLDLSDYIGQVGGRVVAALPSLLRAEWLKDDRIAEVDIIATPIERTDGLVEVELSCDVLLADEGETFPLTFRASAAGVELLGVPLE